MSKDDWKNIVKNASANASSQFGEQAEYSALLAQERERKEREVEGYLNDLVSFLRQQVERFGSSFKYSGERNRGLALLILKRCHCLGLIDNQELNFSIDFSSRGNLGKIFSIQVYIGNRWYPEALIARLEGRDGSSAIIHFLDAKESTGFPFHDGDPSRYNHLKSQRVQVNTAEDVAAAVMNYLNN